MINAVKNNAEVKLDQNCKVVLSTSCNLRVAVSSIEIDTEICTYKTCLFQLFCAFFGQNLYVCCAKKSDFFLQFTHFACAPFLTQVLCICGAVINETFIKLANEL